MSMHNEQSSMQSFRWARQRIGSELVIGIPNNGRLCEEVWHLLLGTSQLHRTHPRSLVATGNGITALSARSNDLPYLLQRGLVDLIFTGRDYVLESRVSARELTDLKFQECQISILRASGQPSNLNSYGNRLKVASQYPNLAHDHFQAQGIPADIIEVSGGAEMYLRLGVVDQIVDAVMSGETAKANGAEVIETITTTSGRVYARTEEKLSQASIRLLAKINEAIGSELTLPTMLNKS